MKSLDKLTLKEMMNDFHLYYGLPDGLVQLPIPDKLKIGRKRLPIPQTLEEFTSNLCYGQRLFLTRKEDNDFGVIVRILDGYYYTLKTGEKWDEDKALLFGKLIINLHVKDIYPTAMHLITLVSEMADREQKLLHREPSKMELAAGIEKLNVYSELTNLDFLRDTMKCTVPEVLLTPYNECLVRFMVAKETTDFQERYFKLMQEDSKPKSKYHA
jgi:hypothetical protein